MEISRINQHRGRKEVDYERRDQESDSGRTDGVCLGCQARHNIGDKFRLEARLLPDQAPLDLGCQILRILERKHDYFEYGCRFLDLSEADENRILQIIFGLQRKKRQV